MGARVKMADLEVIDAILAAMHGHAADSAVLAAGCDALGREAAVGSENRGKIIELGGIDAIQAAMRGHSPDSPVWVAGCGALHDLKLSPSRVMRLSAAYVEALTKPEEDKDQKKVDLSTFSAPPTPRTPDTPKVTFREFGRSLAASVMDTWDALTCGLLGFLLTGILGLAAVMRFRL